MEITRNDSGSVTVVLENGKRFIISEHHTGPSDFIIQVVGDSSGIYIRPIQYEMIGVKIGDKNDH